MFIKKFLLLIFISVFVNAQTIDVDVPSKGMMNSWEKTKVELREIRGHKLGIASAELKKNEKNRYIDVINDGEVKTLCYKGDVADLSAEIYYNFLKDKLVAAEIFFIEKYSNDNKYLVQFIEVSDALINQYGQANDKIFDWTNNLMKEDTDRWGFAISAGHVRIFHVWDFTNAQIRNSIGGNNYEISHIVTIHTNDYTKHLDSVKKKKKHF